MKNMQIRSLVLVLSIGLVLSAAGCGYFGLGRGGTDQTPPTSPETMEAGNEASRSDREQFGDTDEPVSGSAPTPSGSAMPDVDSESSTDMPAGTRSGGDTGLAYRVQVYSFIDRDGAEAAYDRVKQYLSDWSHPVYLEEEDGIYKIRVGDFTEKADADLLRDRMRREGYPDAWTVPIR